MVCHGIDIKRFGMKLLVVLICFIAIPAMASDSPMRQTIDLSGTWNIAEGTMDRIPDVFPYRVPVPGLVDMSSPDFFEVGIVSERRECFWYQRTFTMEGDIPPVALLKIHKAKFGTHVYLNGNDLGDHLPCFTPGYFDIKPYVKGQGEENELVVRVGAHLESVPKSMPNGWDFEKYKYIPGIYDTVEVILAGTPFIQNIQIAPNIKKSSIRLQVELKNTGANYTGMADYCIREKASQTIVSKGTLGRIQLKGDAVTIAEFTLAVPDAHLWSPEDPFLYELEIHTEGDNKTTSFGMRTFDFDPKTGRAVLNGKPYFMRGTNVCIYRFFEDAERDALPWNREWVRRLHEKFKTMHWNSIRYCIGFPPEFWYDIADETGLLIQDEFPIWSLSEWPEELKSEAIVPEYTEWMRERWNHPCVVLWDAQNESVTEETGKALQQVRHLDLSNRRWDNGWGVPQGPHDTLESHPYFFSRDHFQNKAFSMSELANEPGRPRVRDDQKAFKLPIILNEYAWLWINRDGSTTSLTKEAYEHQLGGGSTTEERRELYARYLAALTEFWRCNRECAAVMHFCGLGYSRPGGIERPVAGATSDNFIDLQNLVFESHFERYVKDAFSPVGVMIDVWENKFPSGESLSVPVYAIDDLYSDWDGVIRLQVRKENRIVSEQSKAVSIPSLGRILIAYDVTLPRQSGEYELVAELYRFNDKSVHSYRKFTIK